MPDAAEALVKTGFPKRADGLEFNEIDGGFMVYQSERNRVHYLNHVAVLVLELCNGRDSVEEIAELVKKTYGLTQSLETEIREIVAKMESEALVSI